MIKTSDLIGAEELSTLLPAGNCRLVDCRFSLSDAAKGRQDYLAGHIPGAVYADLDQDLASEITATSGRHPLPDVDTFRRQLEKWGIGNETRVIAYDYGNGALAVRFWWMMKCWLGHEAASVLDGGITAWTAAIGTLESGEVEHEEREFTAVPESAVIATTAEIAEKIRIGAELNLIDARAAPRFRGEVEPLDARAGHVPGARNMPLSGNLNENNEWRGSEELAAAWADFLDENAAEPPVVMCGSGVTACHLILAARLAGLPAPRLYVGSWSEWIRDESRPVATAK